MPSTLDTVFLIRSLTAESRSVGSIAPTAPRAAVTPINGRKKFSANAVKVSAAANAAP